MHFSQYEHGFDRQGTDQVGIRETSEVQVRIQTYTLEVGTETKHARYKMGTRTVEGPSEELWSLGSLVARKTALTRVARFAVPLRCQGGSYMSKSSIQSGSFECCCERTRTGTVSSAQRFLLLFNVPQCR